jgi:hypothetical protein
MPNIRSLAMLLIDDLFKMGTVDELAYTFEQRRDPSVPGLGYPTYLPETPTKSLIARSRRT